MAVSGLINRTTLSAALSEFKTKIQTVINGLTGASIKMSGSDNTTLQSAINGKVAKTDSRLSTSGVYYTGSISEAWGFGICCQGRGFCIPITCGGTITNISGKAFISGSWVTLTNGSLISNNVQRYLNFDQPSGMEIGKSYLCAITCTVS